MVVTQGSGRDSSTPIAHLTIWLGEIRDEVHFALPNYPGDHDREN